MFFSELPFLGLAYPLLGIFEGGLRDVQGKTRPPIYFKFSVPPCKKVDKVSKFRPSNPPKRDIDPRFQIRKIADTNHQEDKLLS